MHRLLLTDGEVLIRSAISRERSIYDSTVLNSLKCSREETRMKIKLKNGISVLLSNLKHSSKPLVESALNFWRRSLSREETILLLQDSAVYEQKDSPIAVPDYQPTSKDVLSVSSFRNAQDVRTDRIEYDKEYVWKVERSDQIKRLSLCSSGTVLVNDETVLNLDFGATSGYRDFPFKHKELHFSTVIAPWSHLKRLGYFDFLFLVLVKICLIEKVLGSEILAEAKLCYPALHTKFETEYLSKLGIDDSSLIDTKSRSRITADCMLLSNNQSRCGRISPSNITLLRERFLPSEPVTSQHRKIFLLRKGTRCIINQDEVISLVGKYGFEILPDTYRTVDEQIQLFRQAASIITPHGAALANLVWCNPGTKVIEFFDGSYTRPNFYYLCRILRLEYDCLIDQAAGQLSHMANQYNNMYVNTVLLEKKLNKIFN